MLPENVFFDSGKGNQNRENPTPPTLNNFKTESHQYPKHMWIFRKTVVYSTYQTPISSIRRNPGINDISMDAFQVVHLVQFWLFPPGIGWVSHIGLATAHFTFSWSDLGEPLEYFAEVLCFELYPLQEKETREHVAFRWQSSKRKMSKIAACQD